MKRARLIYLLLCLFLTIAVFVTGCGSKANQQSVSETKKTETSANTNQNKSDSSGSTSTSSGEEKILSTGPHGETAFPATKLKLTDEEIAKIKEGKYTAAIVMHYAGNDWSTQQIAGLKDTFAKMGIEVVAITDAQFKAEKQVADIETVLAKKPNIIVSIPVDPVSTAPAYKKAAEQGVKIVFMDNTPNGLQQGKDYVSVVSADNYGNGVAAAHILAQKLDKKGKVGVIFHDADFFVTSQRVEGFMKTIKDQYPDITIVARGGIKGPEDGEKVAAAMLTQHPDLNGMFVVWDVPAEGAMAAARTAGRNDLVITTVDLGNNVALEIARNGIVKGLGAQLPYDQGVAEATLAGYALLGKNVPAYVAVPAQPVYRENLLEAYKKVYHKEPPKEILDALNK